MKKYKNQLTDEEADELFLKWNEGDLSAFQEIFEKSQWQVKTLIAKYRGRGFDEKELEQRAQVALVEAMNTFKPGKWSFRMHVFYRIKACIEVFFRKLSIVTVPRYRIGEVKNASIENCFSLEIDQLNPLEALIKKERNIKIRPEHFAKLSHIEKETIKRRFSEKPQTFREIGEALGLTSMAICSAEKRALRKLKEALKPNND